MAPMTRARTRAEPKTTKKPTRTHFKKQQVGMNKSKNVKKEAPKMEDLKIEEFDSVAISSAASPCSTPKAQKFRIPKIETCPPAPMKQRLLPNLKRRPIAFFAPPDLELFFFFALGGNHISS